MTDKNPSVEELKRRLTQILPSVTAETMAEVRKQGERLADLMRRSVPVETGKLKRSIRVEPGRNKVSVRVMAGGELTTVEVRGGSGIPYDYSRGVEFGTAKSTAEPFFWPSYRLLKRPIRSSLSRAVRKGIEKIYRLDNVT